MRRAMRRDMHILFAAIVLGAVACSRTELSVGSVDAARPSVLPKDDADLERIRTLCLKNLEQLAAACK